MIKKQCVVWVGLDLSNSLHFQANNTCRAGIPCAATSFKIIIAIRPSFPPFPTNSRTLFRFRDDNDTVLTNAATILPPSTDHRSHLIVLPLHRLSETISMPKSPSPRNLAGVFAWVSAFASCVFTTSAGSTCLANEDAVATDHSSPPNVVIILVDDMGYGDPGCFNDGSKVATPAIDSLAAEGMRFTDAHAPGPLCHLSRYGLLTGEYPFRATPGAWKDKPTIAEGKTTIASHLKGAGYKTAMVGKWHLGFQESGYENSLPGGPVDRGFDSYFGIRASTDIPPYFYIRNRHAVMPPTDRIAANNSEGWSRIQGAFWREGGISPDLKLPDVLPRFTNEAISVIKQHSSANAGKAEPKPLMLYLAYPAPHTPWLPSEEFAGKSKVGMYGDFTMMVDAEIAKVLKTLDEAKMKQDTLVIFTSDNGPCWYETDDDRFQHDSSGGFRGMKADAWEGGHRMPFICRWPAQVKAKATSDQLICFTDVLATLADMVSSPLKDDEGPDSFSFYAELTGRRRTEKARTEFVMETGSKLKMIRSVDSRGDWKLIDGLGSGGFSKPSRIKPTAGGPKAQLYDIQKDPAETTNELQSPDAMTIAHEKNLRQRMAKIMRSRGHRFLVDSEAVSESK